MKQQRKHTAKDGGKLGVALLILEGVHSAADAFPPLKSASGGALYIAKLVRSFRSNQRQWREFGIFVGGSVASVTQSSPDVCKEMLVKRLEELDRTVQGICKRIDEIRMKSTVARLLTFMKDPDQIRDMRNELDSALQLFQLRLLITAEDDINRILAQIRELDIKEHVAYLKSIDRKLDIIANKLKTVASVGKLEAISGILKSVVQSSSSNSGLKLGSHLSLNSAISLAPVLGAIGLRGWNPDFSLCMAMDYATTHGGSTDDIMRWAERMWGSDSTGKLPQLQASAELPIVPYAVWRGKRSK